ncbi:MAG: transposase [Candidatus Uhrbacteria bacterium]|nr:transposase [Candidatus Uhrbacteria bacterium]
MRFIPLLNFEYYHIFSRGVDKRPIFIDDQDRERFIRGLDVINDSNRPRNLEFRKDSASPDPYLEIAAFCLMSNHFHLLVRQRKDNGVSSFFHRFLNSYARYFNLKHGRTGKLFDGRFKVVHIANDKQLAAVQRYIHLNPTEIIEPAWKDGLCRDVARAWEFIKTYRWSSLIYYLEDLTSGIVFPGLLDGTQGKEHGNILLSALTDSRSQLPT